MIFLGTYGNTSVMDSWWGYEGDDDDIQNLSALAVWCPAPCPHFLANDQAAFLA